ncbi:hypothetical protein [Citrobacter braakii]|uniref:hypothetical protein n=1 Tax=Citrobacter braakii TaxID=57706 RepID=UPI000CDD73AC|nr:hypothetical protein [Citrobacter braakii]POT29868.1 hypothetical protein C3423_22465 [Citrobacter braakii]POT34726.1 hypothetical protein C3431_22300 [Citrobacter braakii]POT39551.1 hypothetical protein C3425_22305 [Citrobacter braakii]POU81094.1 hypothetical protein C3426_22335 [Citrobacter braakii]POV07101.1 hypothetical protein C3427_22525 [Citrobacter braakii]
MIIGALILTIIGLLLAIMAGYLSANNLSPVPAMLGVIGSFIVIAALALAHGPGKVNTPDSPLVTQEAGK